VNIVGSNKHQIRTIINVVDVKWIEISGSVWSVQKWTVEDIRLNMQ